MMNQISSFYFEGGAGLLLHVNGTQNDDNSSTIGDRVSVERIGDNEIRLVTDEDHSLVVTREPENLVVVVTLDRSLFGKTMGLLGNWSDTMTDDFHLPNGTSLGFNLTDEQIHFDFGESCKYGISIGVTIVDYRPNVDNPKSSPLVSPTIQSRRVDFRL